MATRTKERLSERVERLIKERIGRDLESREKKVNPLEKPTLAESEALV